MIIRTSSYLGSVDIKRSRQLAFTLHSGMTITFDKHFQSISEGERFIQWPILVAETDINLAGTDAAGLRHHYLENLNDFLLLASLGSRTRTVCFGWTATDRESYTQYFRRDISIPEGKPEPSVRDGLVSLADYEEFLAETYKVFCGLDNKGPMRGAIGALVPIMEHTIEGNFLSLFTGLEEIVLDYRRRENLEHVLSDLEWLRLRKHLQKSIKSWADVPLSKKQRSWLYNKLDELNRIPLQVAFTQFCERYAINLSDLWPVFKERELFGLSDLRNRLVHGERLPPGALESLVVALQSLKWTVERMVLGILGWPVQRSEVCPTFLHRHATAIAEMPEACSRLSAILSS